MSPVSTARLFSSSTTEEKLLSSELWGMSREHSSRSKIILQKHKIIEVNFMDFQTGWFEIWKKNSFTSCLNTVVRMELPSFSMISAAVNLSSREPRVALARPRNWSTSVKTNKLTVLKSIFFYVNRADWSYKQQCTLVQNWNKIICITQNAISHILPKRLLPGPCWRQRGIRLWAAGSTKWGGCPAAPRTRTATPSCSLDRSHPPSWPRTEGTEMFRQGAGA